jgi:hypothetical protein
MRYKNGLLLKEEWRVAGCDSMRPPQLWTFAHALWIITHKEELEAVGGSIPGAGI